MKTIRTEKELGMALKNHEDEFLVEGDLAAKTFVIHATGKVAWVAATASLVIAIGAAIATMIPDPAEPAEVVVAGLGLGGTVSAFFVPTITAATAAPALMAGISAPAVAVSALLVGVSAGGIGALNALRSYRLTQVKGSTRAVILKRK